MLVLCLHGGCVRFAGCVSVAGCVSLESIVHSGCVRFTGCLSLESTQWLCKVRWLS